MIEVITPEARYALAIGAIFPESTDRFTAKIAAEDWAGALAIVRRAHRLAVLEGWWTENRIPADELRQLLPQAWQDADADTGLRFWPLFRDVGFCGDARPLPDHLVGFRGGQKDDPPGMLWTLDLETARRAALRWPRSASTNAEGQSIRAGIVTTARIPRARVTAHWVGRAGIEVIAHPELIQILGRERIEEPLEVTWEG
ncbi:MAG TPA: hypothetical protein VI277_01155 [Candidatus Limnocylindria bacterium]